MPICVHLITPEHCQIICRRLCWREKNTAARRRINAKLYHGITKTMYLLSTLQRISWALWPIFEGAALDSDLPVIFDNHLRKDWGDQPIQFNLQANKPHITSRTAKLPVFLQKGCNFPSNSAQRFSETEKSVLLSSVHSQETLVYGHQVKSSLRQHKGQHPKRLAFQGSPHKSCFKLHTSCKREKNYEGKLYPPDRLLARVSLPKDN